MKYHIRCNHAEVEKRLICCLGEAQIERSQRLANVQEPEKYTWHIMGEV